MTDLFSQTLNGEVTSGAYTLVLKDDKVDGKVYLPPSYYDNGTSGSTPQYNAYNTPGLMIDNAESRYWDLPKEGRIRWNKLTSLANGRKSISSDEQGYTSWKTTAAQVAQYNQQFGTTMDIFEFMQNKITGAQRIVGDGGGGGGGRSGPPPVVTRSQVNLTHPTAARDLIERSLATELGRRPTKKEYNKFFQALRGEEENSPTVSVTKNNADGTVANTTVKESFDRAQYAQEYAQMDEQYMDTQVTNQAGNALMRLFGVG